MAATTITRATINDDTGDGESGDVLNAAFFGSAIYDKIDQLFTAEAGITLNQAAGDNAILSLESSDVAHGMTAIAYTTSVYGDFKKARGANGGLKISGYDDGEANSALLLQGYQGAAVTTTKSTSGFGVCRINATKKNGTGATTIGADGNILSIEDDGTVRFILDADGDSHQDVGTAWTNFDDHEDVELLHALSAGVSRTGDPLKRAFGRLLTKHRATLERNGIVTFNKNGHHFVNWSRLHMLMVGAVRQQAERLEVTVRDVQRLQRRLTAAERRLKAA